ncbi:MAG TPA: GNAT family N-acetyltransferase [Pedobacter sp.]|nr:GNAT family N-acetyltransferase [Pedobacter sp.]
MDNPKSTVKIPQLQITIAGGSDYPLLIDIWEASVRNTHSFLKSDDIDFYKNFIAGGLLETLAVYCIKIQGLICGFIGMTKNSLEMLFVAPEHFNKGLGTLLLLFAIGKGIDRVEVNEQNQAALRFYQRSGFRIVDRKSLDNFGKPYPILTLGYVG